LAGLQHALRRLGRLRRPARAVVPVPKLHYGFKIEVEAVAVKSAP
jgi:enamine deaminase RidA (YjgF/YER057c/UK114 family)